MSILGGWRHKITYSLPTKAGLKYKHPLVTVYTWCVTTRAPWVDPNHVVPFLHVEVDSYYATPLPLITKKVA